MSIVQSKFLSYYKLKEYKIIYRTELETAHES